MPKKLVLVCGPSGVGKRPLVNAATRHFPKLREVPVMFKPTVPDEDIPGTRRLRTDQLPAVSGPKFVHQEVRGEMHVVNLEEVERAFGTVEDGGAVLVVAYHTLALRIKASPRIQTLVEQDGLRVVTVFICPFTEDEIRACAHPDSVLPHIMFGHQLERSLREAVAVGCMLESIKVLGSTLRSMSVMEELRARRDCDQVITLGDGYLPATWMSDPPTGDAAVALDRFLQIISE